MPFDIKTFLDSIEGAQNTNPHFSHIDALAASGDFATISAIIHGLLDQSERFDLWRFPAQSVFNAATATLAQSNNTDAIEAVLELFDLLSMSDLARRSLVYLRQWASMIGSTSSLSTIMPLLVSGKYDEMMLYVVHELLMYGHDCDLPEVYELRQRQQPHIFARLPLQRLPAEMQSAQVLRKYSKRGSGHSSVSLPQHHEIAPADSSLPLPLNLTITTNDEQQSLLTAQVEPWFELFNGVYDLAVRMCEPPLQPNHVGTALVERLNLQPLANSTHHHAWKVDLARVWQAIFSAAATGGSYEHGWNGALGRWWTWRIIALLIGMNHDDPVHAIAEYAQRCAWFTIQTNSPWFNHDSVDLFFGVMRPDNQTFVVVAATDTD